MSEAYSGLLGAYRYAFRASRSWLFRSYVVVSAVVGGFVAILVVLGLVSWIANPTGLFGEQAFIVVLGLFVVVPLSGPVLLTARRHRLAVDDRRTDALLAVGGYLFALGVYLALVITDPRDHDVAGPVGAVVDVLDTLPATWGLAPPAIAAGVLVALAWLTRPEVE